MNKKNSVHCRLCGAYMGKYNPHDPSHAGAPLSSYLKICYDCGDKIAETEKERRYEEQCESAEAAHQSDCEMDYYSGNE